MTIMVEYDELLGSFVAVCGDHVVIPLSAKTWAEADAQADALEADQELIQDEF